MWIILNCDAYLIFTVLLRREHQLPQSPSLPISRSSRKNPLNRISWLVMCILQGVYCTVDHSLRNLFKIIELKDSSVLSVCGWPNQQQKHWLFSFSPNICEPLQTPMWTAQQTKAQRHAHKMQISLMRASTYSKRVQALNTTDSRAVTMKNSLTTVYFHYHHTNSTQ